VSLPEDWIRRLPKVDLHCHLIGTVRASTFAELARREKLELPADPERIFADINSLPPDPALYRNTVIPVPQGRSADEPEVSYSLFQASKWVIDTLRSADDLTRIVYEAFEDAHRLSNTRHRAVLRRRARAPRGPRLRGQRRGLRRGHPHGRARLRDDRPDDQGHRPFQERRGGA
jgi:hypothetical protein